MGRILKVLGCLFLVLISFSACQKRESQSSGNILAKAYGEKLYVEDVPGIKEALNEKDSNALIKTYRKQWLVNQTMLHQATSNISIAAKDDIKRRVKEYEQTLLLYEYEKTLLPKKIKADISKSTLERYYKENLNTFLLDYPILRFRYVQAPGKMANTIKGMLLNNTSVDSLRVFCDKQMIDCQLDEEKWYPLDYAKALLPQPVNNTDLLAQGTLLSFPNNGNTVFLYVKEARNTGAPVPIEMLEEEIKVIVFNQQKTAYITKAKENLVKKAISDKKVRIYKL